MKPRKPIRKISLKRLKELSGKGFSLNHNSTIRRKLCNAITAGKKYLESRSIQTHTDLDSVPLSMYPQTKNPVKIYSSASYGKQRNPVNKQSTKQKARLHKLAAIRARWWKESQASGKPLICGICDEEILYFEDLASDHIEPGHGKSDSETNLQPAHFR
jgi:hypothetical protein